MEHRSLANIQTVAWGKKSIRSIQNTIKRCNIDVELKFEERVERKIGTEVKTEKKKIA